MKILKIGRDQRCDIVLNSPYVSSLQAELTVLPDDKYILEVKSDTNPTLINGQPAELNKELKVTRGDKIVFGDAPLNWNYVPKHESYPDAKRVVNIGSNYRNEIQVSEPFVSRFHAVLKVTKGKTFIKDLGSTNGTLINGVRIEKNKWIPVKKSDQVSVGNADITAQIKPYLKDSMAWLKGTGIGILCAAVAALIGWVVYILIPHPDPKPDLNTVRTGVAYVTASYSTSVKFDDSPIQPAIWMSVLQTVYPNVPNLSPSELPVQFHDYCATAFFLDQEGRMATNRHVATPWDLDYMSENEQTEIKTSIEKQVNDMFPINVDGIGRPAVDAYNQAFAANPGRYLLWGMIFQQAKQQVLAGNVDDIYGYIDSLIRQLKNSKRSITGKMISISVGYAGVNYTHQDEFDRCQVIAVAPTDDTDIALLQLNKKKTPEFVKWVFNPDEIFTGKLEPQKTPLIWIGYPTGTLMGLDEKTHSMEPEIRRTTCSKLPSKYIFEIEGEPVGGASGSPVFDAETYQLVGVLFGGYNPRTVATTFSMACQAKYLKKMYDEEVGNDNADE